MQSARSARILGLGVAGLLIVGLSACSQSQSNPAASTPKIEEKNFQLTSAQATVRAGFLVGEFEDLRVSERVEQNTGRVVEPPTLLGSLTLKNVSDNQAARPLTAHVTYFDETGQRIRLVGGRGEATFAFPSYQDRLDPGKTTSARLDVPFPAAALKEKRLGEVRVALSYIPVPIQEETMSVKVGVSTTP